MHPHLTRIAGVALVLILCRAALDPGSARVVRDNRAAPANPAVEAGGYRLPPRPPPAIPYSLIGAIADDNRWFAACIPWPWNAFAPGIHHPRTPLGTSTPLQNRLPLATRIPLGTRIPLAIPFP